MQKETCGIYVITERATQRPRYVGQSIGIEGRWGHHKGSRGKFPEDRFDYRVIQECLPAELNFWEKYYIRALKTHWTEGGENQDWGGQHWPKPEEPMSPATRAKIAAANKGQVPHNKGKPCSPATRAKCSATLKGRAKSEEHKAKLRGRAKSEEHKANLSAAKKGNVQSEEHRAKNSAANKGRVLSEEEKAKRSATLKGRAKSEEHKAKLRGRVSPNKGVPMSEEQKAKISAAAKARAALKQAAEWAEIVATEELLTTEIISTPE